MLSLNSLILLQNLLHSQQISVAGTEEEILAILAAKRELAESIEIAKNNPNPSQSV